MVGMDYALGRMANGVMASRMDPPMNEDWRSWHIVRVMFTLRHGSIIPTIFPRVLLVQVWALVIVLASYWWGEKPIREGGIQVGLIMFRFIGMGLSFLLCFRSDYSNNRFEEARMHISELHQNSSNLVRNCLQSFRADTMSVKSGLAAVEICRLTVVYFILCMMYLRGTNFISTRSQLYELLTDKEFFFLRTCAQRQRLTEAQLRMDMSNNERDEAVGWCDDQAASEKQPLRSPVTPRKQTTPNSTRAPGKGRKALWCSAPVNETEPLWGRRALAALMWIGEEIDIYAQDVGMTPKEHKRLLSLIDDQLEMRFAMLCKIRTTSLPFPFINMCEVLLGVYMVLCPFGLLKQFGFFLPLPVGIIGIAMFGLSAVSDAMCDPFGRREGDLPLSEYIEVLMADIGTQMYLNLGMDADLFRRSRNDPPKPWSSPEPKVMASLREILRHKTYPLEEVCEDVSADGMSAQAPHMRVPFYTPAEENFEPKKTA